MAVKELIESSIFQKASKWLLKKIMWLTQGHVITRWGAQSDMVGQRLFPKALGEEHLVSGDCTQCVGLSTCQAL